MLSFVLSPDEVPASAQCAALEWSCNAHGQGSAIPGLLLSLTPAPFIPLAPLWLLLGVRQPGHSCSSLPCCIISYFLSVYNTHLSVDFLSSNLKCPRLQKCPALGVLFHPLGHFPKCSFTLFQLCFVHCYQVQMEKLFVMHFFPNNSQY